MACYKEDLTLPTSTILPNIPFGIGICFLHTSLIIYVPSSFPSSFISVSFFSSILSSIVGLSLISTKGTFKSLILLFVFL